jgi:hypothetical protein
MPLCVAVLAIPGLEAAGRLRRSLLPIAAVTLALATLAEWAFFVDHYSTVGPGRTRAFEAGVAALVERGLTGGRMLYVDHDDAYALTMGQWYALSNGRPRSRIVRLPDGGAPPPGALVLGRTQSCDYECVRLADADTFWLARAASR